MKKKPSVPRAEMRHDVQQIISPITKHFQGKVVTPEAVLWPNSEDLVQRFHALLSGIDWSMYSETTPIKILDLGCGPGFLLDYLESLNVLHLVEYLGVDLSAQILDSARQRWPGQRFLLRDIRVEPFSDNCFDFAMLCGVFTVRFSLSHQQMSKLMEETLLATWKSVKSGLSYNVMSAHVDWEREDLFHLSTDEAIAMAIDRLHTRHVRILHDYGLYEYSLLLFKTPQISSITTPEKWQSDKLE